MFNALPPANIPSYKFIQNEILATIQENKLRTGDMIPSEKALAEQYRVSVGTVKRALGNLVVQGHLYRRQGRGTFVSGGFVRPDSTRIYKALSFFDQEDQEQGSLFLSNTPGKGDAAFSKATGLPEGTPVFTLRRVLFSGGKRFAYLTSHMYAEKLPNFEKIEAAEFEKNALYIILDRKYGIHNLRLRELLSAVPADAAAAKYLEVPQGTPVLRSDLVFKTYKEEPYEYRVSYCRTDELKLFREF